MRSLLQRRSARLLTVSYAVALSLVGGTTVVIHHHGGQNIARQERLGEMINVSGRQRMLSQRIAYLRRLVEARRSEPEAQKAASDYAIALEAFIDAHDRLTRGDLLWADDHPRAASIANVYYAQRLDNDLRRYVVEAELFAEAAAVDDRGPMPERPDDILGRLDAITNLHEEASEEIVAEGRAFARQAVIVVVLLLLAEAIFVVVPTARRLARVEDELTEMATTDPLTGAQNRRSLFGAAQGLMRLAARARRPVSAIIFDIDHFKKVNDEHGHAVGDEAIKHVVTIANEVVRDSDLFGRIGGEEFVVICPETSADGGLQVAEKIREAIAAAPVPLEEGELALTVSVGVHGGLPSRQDRAEDFVAQADEALYEAKRSGRNCTVASNAQDAGLALSVA